MQASETLAAIRKQLEAERADLHSQIDAIEIENQSPQDDAGIGNHMADDASELFVRERNVSLRGNAEELIAQIDAALERLDSGGYGICARCGQQIAPERLQALPYVTLCITCQSAVERER